PSRPSSPSPACATSSSPGSPPIPAARPRPPYAATASIRSEDGAHHRALVGAVPDGPAVACADGGERAPEVFVGGGGLRRGVLWGAPGRGRRGRVDPRDGGGDVGVGGVEPQRRQQALRVKGA